MAGAADEYPDIELHLIGPLQSNKAQEAVEFFDVIETVDRDKIATGDRRGNRGDGQHPRLLVQVNTGREPQKAGVLPEEADAFIANLPGAPTGSRSQGLMCVPPVEQQASPHFALLAEIAARNGLKFCPWG